MKEDQLIAECIKNKSRAQRQLFDVYYKKAFRLAVRYLCNFHDTEDVLMESFSRVFKNIRHFEFRGEGSLEKWINTVVINESLRFLKQRRLMHFEEDINLLITDTQDYFESDIIDPEEVRQILTQMPLGYRTVFNLYAIEGFQHKEIAAMLDISESTSRTQLNKARKFIIQRIEFKISYENK